MIYIIIAIIVLVIWAWFEYESIACVLFFGICGGALVGLLFSLIVGGFIGTFLPTKTVVTEVRPIVALQDGSEIEGRFFLGCGIVDKNMKYTFMAETQYGYEMETMPVDHVAIKYGDNPQIATYQTQFTNSLWNWFAITLEGNRYVITVPDGTIKQDYSIDLE